MATLSTTLPTASARPQPRPASANRTGRRARRAASTAFRASVALGGLGAAALMFVATRLFATWRIAPAATTGHVTLLGQSFSYPTANAAALAIVALSLLGLAAVLAGASGLAREVYQSWRLARRLSRQRPGTPRDAVHVIDDRLPHAFCAGLLRPRVYLSTGALALLADAELQAVLAHERHHARRRDPLRMALGRAIARGLFFSPSLRTLVSRHERLAELGADEAAVADAPDLRPALARAMLSFVDAAGAGVAPERVDHLVGEPVAWRLPRAAVLSGLAVTGVVAGVGMLAARVASGSATLALPFLSPRPCLLIVAVLLATPCPVFRAGRAPARNNP